MTVHAAFNPKRGANNVVATSTTSASVSTLAGSKSVRVCNPDSAIIIYVRIGTGAQTATSADTPVLPGETLILSKGQDEDTLAYLAASGTPAFHFQPGEGGI